MHFRRMRIPHFDFAIKNFIIGYKENLMRNLVPNFQVLCTKIESCTYKNIADFRRVRLSFNIEAHNYYCH